jgi:uncharacterized phage-associated protein
MEMANVSDVAAAILERQGSMSTWKLQKLVYYCQAWHLVWDETPLFGDAIQAWSNGPVVRSLYDLHKGKFSVAAGSFGDPTKLAQNESETVGAVLKVYGGMSGADIAALTHREQPWLRAREGLADGERGNSEITLESMSEYYGGLI